MMAKIIKLLLLLNIHHELRYNLNAVDGYLIK